MSAIFKHCDFVMLLWYKLASKKWETKRILQAAKLLGENQLDYKFLKGNMYDFFFLQRFSDG